jgi:glycosyltransferase involved in cell wall biosynthesis
MNARSGEPLVSVIIPAFNAERTLAETLASALAQTWRNLWVLGWLDRRRFERFEALDRVYGERLHS